MCYSAQVVAEYLRYVRMFGARLGIREYVELFLRRARETYGLKLPKAMVVELLNSRDPALLEVAALAAEIVRGDATRFEQELFAQRKRLADADRKLAERPSKAAAESKRIAEDKIARALRWLADLRQPDPMPKDSRIYPVWYAPVMVSEAGLRVIKPMRYQCRPAGKPAFYDSKYPGTFNARRDNLEGFWKGQFGRTHGVMVVEAFYENVSRDGQNVVLEFRARTGQPMLAACLWSHWTGADQPNLLSFAAITDEPPAEVLATGHDRCLVPIKPEHIDAWLNPDPKNLQASYAILDDRERPYYEHRMAA